MINPNRQTSEDVLRRLKGASYERMRVELKCSIELLMKDFEVDWDIIANQLGRPLDGGLRIKEEVIGGELSLWELNSLAHIFSCEPYIIFRPREPWTKT